MPETLKDVLRVLLVDDDDVDTMSAQRVMKRSGVPVEVACESDVRVGLARASQEEFDLLIFDLIHPAFTREQLLAALPALATERRAIVLRTAAEGQLVPHEFVEAGVATVLSKSAQGDESLARVLGDLQGARLEERAAAPQRPYAVAPSTLLEGSRLAKLESYAVLDAPPEPLLDRLTELASKVCGTPIALVSLIDAKRQWFKSRVGLDASETPREVAFCAHAIHDPSRPLEVRDAHTDPRFRENPLVTGDPNVRFYFGVPLTTEECLPLGTLCAIDTKPRELSDEQRKTMVDLARLAEDGLRIEAAIRAAEARFA